MSFGISPLDFGINAHALLHSETNPEKIEGHYMENGLADFNRNGIPDRDEGFDKPTSTDAGGSSNDSNTDENTTSQNCDDHQCPEGKNVMTSTNADGTVECSCFDSGKAVRAVGYGLGAIAVVGLLTTGLIVYGVVKVTGKIFGN